MEQTNKEFTKLLDVVEKIDQLIHEKIYLKYTEEDDRWIAKQIQVATEDLDSLYRTLEIEI